MKTQEKKIIAMAGTYPVYDNYGEGVTVKKIQDEDGREAFEITIPSCPRIFGEGQTHTEVKYINTVIEYATACAKIIAKKKAKGRWE